MKTNKKDDEFEVHRKVDRMCARAEKLHGQGLEEEARALLDKAMDLLAEDLESLATQETKHP